MSAGLFAGTNRIPTPERANGAGTGTISCPYCLAGDKLGRDPREVKPPAGPRGMPYGRLQLGRGLELSSEATSLKAVTLADFAMNASSYFHMSMTQP